MVRGLSVGLLVGVLALSGHGYEVKTPPLSTDWTYKVGTDAWPEYPRPLLQRPQWKSLNGVWTMRSASAGDVGAPPVGQTFSQDVLVPSCLESGLSGVMETGHSWTWFRTTFTVPAEWSGDGGKNGRRVKLNFEAVDYEASVYLNGRPVGSHRGGYWHFSLDATEAVSLDGSNELLVLVYDPTDGAGENVPVGKQRLAPSHIFYTPCTGIWQSVWIESVPADHITDLDVTADMDGTVNVTVHSSSGESREVGVSITDADGTTVASHKASSKALFSFAVESPRLWSPSEPHLYNVTVQLGEDRVVSYTAFRTISKGRVDGVLRPLINGRFFFHFGPLDQGYWPDGLHTPPSREAMVSDLRVLKDLGFNMLRKHIKVEPALFYQACDQLGLLVIQDMPSLGRLDIEPTEAQQTEFERQYELLIRQHRNYPSIYTWVIYNEGWGQMRTARHPEEELARRTREELDPTRLVIATSGWHDYGFGDWHDNHHYANPQCGSPFYSLASTPYDPDRIAIQGEFGGIGLNVSSEHLWKVQAAIDAINQTYEIDQSQEAFDYRGHRLLDELRDQVERWACSAAIYTQTTDVEGEVNGLLTYDRRVLKVNRDLWRSDIQALYDTAERRVGGVAAPTLL